MSNFGMPDPAATEQRMQSIVAVESLCTSPEDDNSGRMVIAAVESLADDVPHGADIKLKTSDQNDNQTGKGCQAGRNDVDRQTPDQSNRSAKQTSTDSRPPPAEVIIVSDSDDEVCVTKVEAPKPPRSNCPATNTASVATPTSAEQFPPVRVSSGPLPSTPVSMPLILRTSTPLSTNQARVLRPLLPTAPPGANFVVQPGLVPRCAPSAGLVRCGFPAPIGSHSLYNLTPAPRAQNSFRGRPRLVQDPTAPKYSMIQPTPMISDTSVPHKGRFLLVYQRRMPLNVTLPQFDGKLTETSTHTAQVPVDAMRILPTSSTALSNLSEARHSSTAASIKNGKCVPHNSPPVTLNHSLVASTSKSQKGRDMTPGQTSSNSSILTGVAAGQSSPTGAPGGTSPRTARGRLSRAIVQNSKKTPGTPIRPGTTIIHRRVTKKEVRNLHLDQINTLVMRYGTEVLEEVTLEDIVMKGLNEWRHPKNIKTTPRLYPPRQFKAPVALADQVVEISSDDDDNDTRWTTVRIKREKVDSEGRLCRRPTQAQDTPTETPKERLLSGLGLVLKAEAARLQTLRPMKKDVVAALKDRRTIKKYIMCPLVPIIKADCIYKYVIAKNIMRPQTFQSVRFESNVFKPRKRRCKSIVFGRSKKKPKVDVTKPEVKESIQTNSVASDEGSDTEIEADFSQKLPSPSPGSSETVPQVVSKIDEHALSNIKNRVELQKLIADLETKSLWTSFSTAQAQKNSWTPLVALTRINLNNVNVAELCRSAAAPQPKSPLKNCVRQMERRCCHCRFSCLNILSLREHIWEYHGIKLSD